VKSFLRFCFRLTIILKESLVEYWKDNVPHLASSLAFYTMVSLAPLATVVVAVVGFIFGPAAARGDIIEHIEAYTGEQVAATIQGVIEKAWISPSGQIATVASVGAVLVTSTAVFVELRHSINSVWRVRATESIGSVLLVRFLSFLLVLGTGLLLVAILLADMGVAMITSHLQGFVPGVDRLVILINATLPFLVITLVFAVIYRVLPDVRMPWRHIMVGAILTAFLFMVGRYLLGLYLSRRTFASAYGAAGSLFIFLIWLYYSAQVFLFGAEITYVYARQSGMTVGVVREPESIQGQARGGRRRMIGTRRPYESGSDVTDATGKEINMSILLIVIILVAGLVIFSVQNASPVSVTFLLWHFSASLAIVVFLALITGVVIIAVISLIVRLKRSRRRSPAGDRLLGDRDAPGHDTPRE
jgi:membrane protein